MSKLRWAKWFWADWSNDTALNLCSIPARGLWMSLLCMAAQGEPYGTVTIKGRVPTEDELFSLIAPRGTRRRDFGLWLTELETKNVATRDSRGALQSFRMVHEGALAETRIAAAKSGWQRPQSDHSPTNLAPLASQTGVTPSPVMNGAQHHSDGQVNGQSADDLHLQSQGNNSDLHVQSGDFASIEVEVEGDSESPRSPPKGGRAAPSNQSSKKSRRRDRHGYLTLVKESVH